MSLAPDLGDAQAAAPQAISPTWPDEFVHFTARLLIADIF